MTWCQTFSGRAFDLLHPKPEQVRAKDLLHQLVAIPRFAGATRDRWSVAQHTLLCEALLPVEAGPFVRLEVLLHDMHEAYIGDITRPVEQALAVLGAGSAVEQLKERIQDSITRAFGLKRYSGPSNLLQQVDDLALATEKELLMAETAEWPGMPPVTQFARAALFQVPTCDPGGVLRGRLREAMKACWLRPLPSLGL